MLTHERVGFDILKERPKPGEDPATRLKITIRNHALRLLEQRQGPLKERITTGILDDLGFESMINETRIDILENLATFKLWQWHWDPNPKPKYQLWVSGECEEVGYTQPRFTVYWEENGQVHFKAFVGNQNSQECLDIANILSVDKKYSNLDELRANIIGFTPPEGVTWPNYLKEHILLEAGVWENIQSGQDLILQERAMQVSAEIIPMYYSWMQRARRGYEQYYVGTLIEIAAANRGFPIQSRGSCDKSNAEMLKNFTIPSVSDLRSKVTQIQNIAVEAEKMADEFDYKDFGPCSICGKQTRICPPPKGCNACRDCTVADNKKNLLLAA